MNRLPRIAPRTCRATSRSKPGRAVASILLFASTAMLAAGCQPRSPTVTESTQEPIVSSATPTIGLTSTSGPRLTQAPTPAALPPPLSADELEGACPEDGNLFEGGGFASGLEGWQARYGSLRHTLKTYVGEPGAGVLIADYSSADGSRLALAGRCVDLNAGSGAAASRELRLEAYLLAMPEIESISLSVFFHAGAGCRGDILDVVGPPAVQPGTGWTFVSLLSPIPPDAMAADFVVRAVGQSPSGRGLIDRICASTR